MSENLKEDIELLKQNEEAKIELANEELVQIAGGRSTKKCPGGKKQPERGCLWEKCGCWSVKDFETLQWYHCSYYGKDFPS